jgi:hypothetical protein
MIPVRSSPVPSPEPPPDEATVKERARLDVPLSPIAAARLEEGLASARRGEIAPWGDFSQYAVDDDD